MKLHEFYTAGAGTALLIGNPNAAAINAPKGKKYDAWKDAQGNALVDQQLGASAGLLAGAGIGAGAGALASRSNLGKRIAAGGSAGGDIAERLAKFKIAKKAFTPAGALVGGIAGLGIGSAAGLYHGHYGKRAQEIRNRHLSADLKPVLRELAAISEGLKEFAMVRDESGRYVEVPEQNNGNTALKVGAGVAGLAAVGGAYKGHQAVMNKFAPAGPQQAGFGAVKEAYGNAAKAGLSAIKGASSGAMSATKGGLRGGLLKIARALK